MKEIVYSEKESLRFNKKCYRLKANSVQIPDLKKQILDEGADILILRLPSSDINNHNKLSNMGFPYLHADTLVDYWADLRNLEINETRNDIQLIRVSDSNQQKLEEMIPIIFEGYKNHYFCNPHLEPEKINAGYVEWATSYVDQKNKISWLVKKEGEIVGFANCSFDGENKDCRCVLFGVLPEHTGQGIYSDMMREAQKVFKGKGYHNIWASTQVQNFASQKVWLREGFRLRDSFETYHINAMLSHAPKGTKEISFMITQKDLNRFTENLDLNIESQLVQEVIFKSYLSNHFEMKLSEAGATLIENTNLFLAPPDVEGEYQARIATLNQRDDEVIKVIASVFDQKGDRCLVSYNTLFTQT